MYHPARSRGEGTVFWLVFAPFMVLLCAVFVAHNDPQVSQPAKALTAPVAKPQQKAELRLAKKVSEHFGVPPGLAEKIVSSATIHAERENLPVSLVLAVIGKESSFRPVAVNQKDYGLMQVNIHWHKNLVDSLGGPKALLQVDPAIHAGTHVLSQYVRKYGVYQGLRAYNGLGKRNSYPSDVLKIQKLFS